MTVLYAMHVVVYFVCRVGCRSFGPLVCELCVVVSARAHSRGRGTCRTWLSSQRRTSDRSCATTLPGDRGAIPAVAVHETKRAADVRVRAGGRRWGSGGRAGGVERVR